MERDTIHPRQAKPLPWREDASHSFSPPEKEEVSSPEREAVVFAHFFHHLLQYSTSFLGQGAPTPLTFASPACKSVAMRPAIEGHTRMGINTPDASASVPAPLRPSSGTRSSVRMGEDASLPAETVLLSNPSLPSPPPFHTDHSTAMHSEAREKMDASEITHTNNPPPHSHRFPTEMDDQKWTSAKTLSRMEMNRLACGIDAIAAPLMHTIHALECLEDPLDRAGVDPLESNTVADAKTEKNEMRGKGEKKMVFEGSPSMTGAAERAGNGSSPFVVHFLATLADGLQPMDIPPLLYHSHRTLSRRERKKEEMEWRSLLSSSSSAALVSSFIPVQKTLHAIASHGVSSSSISSRSLAERVYCLTHHGVRLRVERVHTLLRQCLHAAAWKAEASAKERVKTEKGERNARGTTADPLPSDLDERLGMIAVQQWLVEECMMRYQELVTATNGLTHVLREQETQDKERVTMEEKEWSRPAPSAAVEANETPPQAPFYPTHTTTTSTSPSSPSARVDHALHTATVEVEKAYMALIHFFHRLTVRPPHSPLCFASASSPYAAFTREADDPTRRVMHHEEEEEEEGGVSPCGHSPRWSFQVWSCPVFCATPTSFPMVQSCQWASSVPHRVEVEMAVPAQLQWGHRVSPPWEEREVGSPMTLQCMAAHLYRAGCYSSLQGLSSPSVLPSRPPTVTETDIDPSGRTRTAVLSFAHDAPSRASSVAAMPRVHTETSPLLLRTEQGRKLALLLRHLPAAAAIETLVVRERVEPFVPPPLSLPPSATPDVGGKGGEPLGEKEEEERQWRERKWNRNSSSSSPPSPPPPPLRASTTHLRLTLHSPSFSASLLQWAATEAPQRPSATSHRTAAALASSGTPPTSWGSLLRRDHASGGHRGGRSIGSAMMSLAAAAAVTPSVLSFPSPTVSSMASSGGSTHRMRPYGGFLVRDSFLPRLSGASSSPSSSLVEGEEGEDGLCCPAVVPPRPPPWETVLDEDDTSRTAVEGNADPFRLDERRRTHTTGMTTTTTTTPSVVPPFVSPSLSALLEDVRRNTLLFPAPLDDGAATPTTTVEPPSRNGGAPSRRKAKGSTLPTKADGEATRLENVPEVLPIRPHSALDASLLRSTEKKKKAAHGAEEGRREMVQALVQNATRVASTPKKERVSSVRSPRHSLASIVEKVVPKTSSVAPTAVSMADVSPMGGSTSAVGEEVVVPTFLHSEIPQKKGKSPPLPLVSLPVVNVPQSSSRLDTSASFVETADGVLSPSEGIEVDPAPSPPPLHRPHSSKATPTFPSPYRFANGVELQYISFDTMVLRRHFTKKPWEIAIECLECAEDFPHFLPMRLKKLPPLRRIKKHGKWIPAKHPFLTEFASSSPHNWYIDTVNGIAARHPDHTLPLIATLTKMIVKFRRL